MKMWLIIWGHRLCWRGDWISRALSPVFFYFFCPYPIREMNGRYSAKACNQVGCCGCSNARRFNFPSG